MSEIDQKTLRTISAGVVGGIIGGSLGLVPIAGWLLGGIVGGAAAALVADYLGEGHAKRPRTTASEAPADTKPAE